MRRRRLPVATGGVPVVVIRLVCADQVHAALRTVTRPIASHVRMHRADVRVRVAPGCRGRRARLPPMPHVRSVVVGGGLAVVAPRVRVTLRGVRLQLTCGYEAHAALRTVAGPIAGDLRVHRADVASGSKVGFHGSTSSGSRGMRGAARPSVPADYAALREWDSGGAPRLGRRRRSTGQPADERRDRAGFRRRYQPQDSSSSGRLSAVDIPNRGIAYGTGSHVFCRWCDR